MGLPSKNVSMSIGFNFGNHAMKDYGEWNEDSAFASPHGSFGRIVGLVGKVVIIMNNKVSLVMSFVCRRLDGLAI